MSTATKKTLVYKTRCYWHWVLYLYKKSELLWCAEWKSCWWTGFYLWLQGGQLHRTTITESLNIFNVSSCFMKHKIALWELITTNKQFDWSIASYRHDTISLTTQTFISWVILSRLNSKLRKRKLSGWLMEKRLQRVVKINN